MKRASEVVEQLISLAFDSDPEESDLTLAEALRLYAALVAGEAVSDIMSAGKAEKKPESAAAVTAQRVYEAGRERSGAEEPDDGDPAEEEATAPDTHTHTHGGTH